MENNPLVSIIIPIYKVEKYIDECLLSCISQTYKNIEIIAVNDGSPDNCGDIIEQYATTDNRIKHVKQVNKGLPKARIAGIETANGEYIMFVDGDDFVETNIVKIMVDEILHTKADMVFSDAYRWTDEGVKSNFLVNYKNAIINNGIDYLEADIYNYIWGKLYKYELLLNLTPQTVNVYEDYFFNLQILPKCEKVVYLKKNLYFYRINNNSIINLKFRSLTEQFLEHSIQRVAILEQGYCTKKINNIILYDNITMIHRCFIFLEYNKRVKELVDLTYERYEFPLKDLKHIKMGLFLFMAKFTPKLAQFIHKFNRAKRHEN